MLPKISILIAARNEEQNILACLQSVDVLDYPKKKLQILVGNDASEDATESIIRQFVEHKPEFKILNITKKVAPLQGKANVLAQLAHEADGDYFFYTDADIILPKTWIKAMLFYFDSPKVGVVTGCTSIVEGSIFQKLQGIEWITALGLIKKMADYQIPVTGMGNNMAVSAKAYWATGGFEKIGFSIVEDYALFKAIVAKKFEFRQAFEADVLAKTKAPNSLLDYLQQRKRWLRGVFQSSLWIRIPLLIQTFFLPILLLLDLCFGTKVALLFWLSKLFWQTPTLLYFLKKLKLLKLCIYLPFYELYMLIMPLIQLFFYFLPFQISWKNRVYD